MTRTLVKITNDEMWSEDKMKKLLVLVMIAVLCLFCLASCSVLGFHSISYKNAHTESYLLDGYAPKWALPGDTVVLRTGPIMDVSLVFYANGIKLTQTHADSDYWEYVFTMPDEDVVITHDVIDGFKQRQCIDHLDDDEDGVCDDCNSEYKFLFKLTYDTSGYELDRVGAGYKGGDVAIPDEHNGLPVVEIGYGAFKSEKKLTSIIIPDSVTLISDDAFENQTSLTSVNVGKNVVTIGVSAFEGCTSLKAVVIGDSTENVSAHAFDRCTSLESIALGKNVKKIGGSAFEGCISLKTITIPASIEEMGAWVFYDTDMTDIYFGVSAPGENWSEEWNQYLDKSVSIHWAE